MHADEPVLAERGLQQFRLSKNKSVSFLQSLFPVPGLPQTPGNTLHSVFCAKAIPGPDHPVSDAP